MPASADTQKATRKRGNTYLLSLWLCWMNKILFKPREEVNGLRNAACAKVMHVWSSEDSEEED